MQKLERFNYTVENKAEISNIAADALSGRLDMHGSKKKFVHFADQQGIPLVTEQVFVADSAVHCSYVCTVRPTHGKIRTTFGMKTTIPVDKNLD